MEIRYFIQHLFSFGDFNTSQFPNDEILELKTGAQVMFIRNDTSNEKKFYNGKLAKVSYLDKNEIRVIFEDSDEEISVSKETWDHKKYILDENQKIQEEIQGRFEQYPIRLAWAVTIHKSQGLTFDRMIIDAGESFASGQVYVALSRCRTLDGIVLKSKITSKIIFSDNRINDFQNETRTKESLFDIIKREKYTHALRKFTTKIDISWLSNTIISWKNQANFTKFLDQKKVNILFKIILLEINNLINIFNKFKNIVNKKHTDFLNEKISDSTISTTIHVFLCRT